MADLEQTQIVTRAQALDLVTGNRVHCLELSLDGEIEALGGTIHPVPLAPRFPWQFRRLLRTHRFTAVHAHVQLFSGWLLRLAHLEKIPIRIAHLSPTTTC